MRFSLIIAAFVSILLAHAHADEIPLPGHQDVLAGDEIAQQVMEAFSEDLTPVQAHYVDGMSEGTLYITIDPADNRGEAMQAFVAREIDARNMKPVSVELKTR